VFQTYDGFSVEYRDASHKYWIHRDGQRTPVVSVTTALRILDKPGLQKWYEDGGAQGAMRLLSEHWIALEEASTMSGRELGDLVREHRVGADAIRDAAADRGTTIHRVLELWATEREVPNIADFPSEHHGYVQGLAAWLLQASPMPLMVEQFVVSPAHGYAGRVDFRGLVRGLDTLVDLKTGRTGVPWPEAHVQARAYAMASAECGLGMPERIMIVGVSDAGGFVEAECCAGEEDWLTVLEAYRRFGRVRSDVAAQSRVRDVADA
jgi:hypothetical protein